MPDYDTLYEVWLNLMKTVERVVFRKSWNRKCCKVHRMTQTKLKESGIKSTLHMCTVVHRVPNFRPFRSKISRYWDIPHFRFPSDSYVKISKCHKIFNYVLRRMNCQFRRTKSYVFSPTCRPEIISPTQDLLLSPTLDLLTLTNSKTYLLRRAYLRLTL